MKKLLLTTALIACCLTSLFSQSCLPDGFIFETQAQIDSFQINYPGCTEIEGNVSIGGDDITNLDGLVVSTAIGGDLKIYNNHNLHNLTGLDNLAIIGGDINIGIFSGPGGGFLGNDSLASISSLDLLETVSGDLVIIGNPLLTDLTGLHNITNIQGDLSISADSSLNNLSGLGSLTNIAGGFYMGGNQSIENLIGLENLISIDGDLWIGGLGYFDSPDKTKILNNPSLTSLEGLNNLTSIGGDLYLGGLDVLINLDGLENLNFIGDQLKIAGNGSLNSIIGLQNLSSVGTGIQIWNNDALTSLSGLDNIDLVPIIYLEVILNNLLTTCEVQSICDYLVAPNGTVEIYDNAPGCNSQQEVEEACDSIVSVEVLRIEDTFSIYPNPATKEIFITTKNGNTIKEVNIYNQVGQRLIHENRSMNMIDVSSLKQGMYAIELVTNDIKVKEKLIIR